MSRGPVHPDGDQGEKHCLAPWLHPTFLSWESPFPPPPSLIYSSLKNW